MRALLFLLFGLSLHAVPVRAQIPAVQTAVAQVSLDSLTHFVRQLTGEAPVVIGGVQDTIRSRHFQHPGNEKAFRFLREKMQSYGLSVDSVTVGLRKSLVATLPGNSMKAYSVGAHYDVVGNAVLPFAGADDDGSGCAAVIEAARIFSAMPQMPLTLRFCFWDEEELGMLGSKDYTVMALDPAPHRGYLNLDMLGYDGNGDSLIELYTAPQGASRTFADVAENVRALYNIGLQIERIDPGPNNTDYGPFWDLNYTAIGIAEDLTGDRNPKYHQFGDSLVLFDLPYFRKLTQLAVAILAQSALADPLGVAENAAAAGDFILYAQHSSGVNALAVRAPTDGQLHLALYAATGQRVWAWGGEVHAGRQILTPGERPPGVYYAVGIFQRSGSAPVVRRIPVVMR